MRADFMVDNGHAFEWEQGIEWTGILTFARYKSLILALQSFLDGKKHMIAYCDLFRADGTFICRILCQYNAFTTIYTMSIDVPGQFGFQEIRSNAKNISL